LSLAQQAGTACPLVERCDGHLAAGERLPQKALYLRGTQVARISPHDAILVHEPK
jgi:hypothetical protein